MVFYFNGNKVERLGEPIVLQSQGLRVKRYLLERRLGQGGMGVVYAAWDEKEKRRVAIKSIKLDEMDEDGEMLRRFKNEAKNVARLNHPNIVHIYSEDGLDLEQINRIIMPYMVMEYAEGGDLQERLKALGAERLYPLKRTLHLFEQLCDAIEHMHQRNIIHRDLKPSNVLFKSADIEYDELMLGDFGLSIHEDASLISYPTAGTPAYRAPEQAFGEAKKESDIFSLGILLYQLCTGRFPFNHYGRTYPPPKPSSVNSALPLRLDTVLLKALHEHPAQRFSTASEFLAQVRSAIEDVLPPSTPSVSSLSNLSSSQEFNSDRSALSVPSSSIVDVPVPANGERNQTGKTKPVSIPPSIMIPSPPTGPNTQKPVDVQASTNHSNVSMPTTPRPVFDVTDNSSLLPPPLQGVLSPTPLQNIPALAKKPEAPSITPIPPKSGSNNVPSGNMGNIAAAGTGVVRGAALGGAMMNRGGGAGTGTPQRANADSPKLPNNRPRRRKSGLVVLIAALVLLALLLSCVGFAYLQPTTFASVVRSVNAVVPSLAGTTTVTIVPDNQIVAHSYVVSAVVGTPDPNQRQVKAFPLSYTTTAKSATVAATGRKDIGGTPAKGILSFLNGGGAPYTFGTKTPITSSSGIVVFLDVPVIIPAADPVAGTLGKATGTATVSTTGANTNIPAGGINTSASGNVLTIINNSAFTGGKDAAHYNFVKQSDIDSAAQPLQTSLTQDAQNSLKKQPATGQTLASGSQCTPKVTSDHLAGDTGVNVANVTVTVAVTCTAEAYDAAGLQALAKTLMRQQVDQDPTLGKDYLLQGQVLTDTSIESIKNGTVFLSVNSKGVYAYAGLDAQKSQLANLIKGKTAAQAITLLKSQGHVKDASLPSGVTTLPTDVSQIIIVIQMPQGFSGGGTTTGGNPVPTTVTGNG